MYAEDKLSHNWLAKKNVNAKVREVLNGFSGTVLDKLWPDERETAGYFVTARKP